MPKISVIVPVYKVEPYIHRCVDSILGQTFSNFELILVDDGSPDNCGAICDEYAQKDSRVRVIHKENRGASAARNAGIEVARGKYIMFCDSDDLVSPMWVARMMQYADGKTLPMGAYCHEVSQIGKEMILAVPSGEQLNASCYFTFARAGLAGYLCNSLFVTRIIKENGLRLRECRERRDYNEDLLFALQYVRHVERIVYTGCADYLYDTHAESLSRAYSELYFQKYQEKFELWYQFLRDFGGREEEYTQLAQTSVYHFLTALHEAFRSGNNQEFREIVRSDAMEQCLKLSDCPNENARVISLLRKKASFLLWILFILSSMKGRKK